MEPDVSAEPPAAPTPRRWRTPALLFVGALVVFAAFAGPRLRIHSKDNHFVYLADAFLHGQVELRRVPHHQNDWASYDVLELKGASAEAHGPSVSGFFTRRNGKPNEFRTLDKRDLDIPPADRGESARRYFVSFPPMPAVLMMPVVAVAGYGTNDVIFTLLFAAFNVALVFLLLQRLTLTGHGRRSRTENLWLTLLFGFGSAHLWCSVLGQVWFTALVIGVTFHLGYLYFAIDARRPLLAGLCLAAAFSTRATLVFAAVFFYWQLFFPNDGRPLPVAERWRRFALFSAPCAAAGLALLAYNHARFGSLAEFGHTYLATGTIPRIRDFGLFHHRFLNRNLHAAFTLVPEVVDESPYLRLSKHGMGVFFSSPALLALLWPRHRARLTRALWVTVAVLCVPLMLYQNTGWEQYSFRFVLDVLPLLIVLLALGARPISRPLKALIVAGVLVNALGAGTFHRANKLYGHHMAEEPRR